MTLMLLMLIAIIAININCYASTIFVLYDYVSTININYYVSTGFLSYEIRLSYTSLVLYISFLPYLFVIIVYI